MTFKDELFKIDAHGSQSQQTKKNLSLKAKYSACSIMFILIWILMCVLLIQFWIYWFWSASNVLSSFERFRRTKELFYFILLTKAFNIDTRSVTDIETENVYNDVLNRLYNFNSDVSSDKRS